MVEVILGLISLATVVLGFLSGRNEFRAARQQRAIDQCNAEREQLAATNERQQREIDDLKARLAASEADRAALHDQLARLKTGLAEVTKPTG